jgi:mRNA interferase RelE/StbE
LSSAGGWRVELSKRAARDLRQLDPQVRRRVIDSLEGLVSDPPKGDVVRLRGSDEWRLRVGAWRVRFERDDAGRVIYVLRVLPRGRAYDR